MSLSENIAVAPSEADEVEAGIGADPPLSELLTADTQTLTAAAVGAGISIGFAIVLYFIR